MYFNEWNLISYRDIYDIFNKSSEQNTTSVNRNFDTRLYQKTHVLGKQMWYGDTFYYTKFDKIFDKGGLSHIVEELYDIKHQGANNLDIKCL